MLQKIKKLINEYADIYAQAWATGSFRDPIASMVRNDIADDFRRISYLDSNKYLIKASCGTGRYTAVPWIAVFDKRITEKATEGVYIVYLLNKDTKELFLTLAQAATGRTLSELKNNTKQIQKQLGIENPKTIVCGSDALQAALRQKDTPWLI